MADTDDVPSTYWDEMKSMYADLGLPWVVWREDEPDEMDCV